ncbi:MAG: hypothetical protein K2L21_05595 [Muribaculaceae bacterium]|nr:hypothetical protein [Muribaculaceae bacterium]
MIKKILTAIALCVAAQAHAAENCDTLLRAGNASLTIAETDSCVEVTVEDAAGRVTIAEPFPARGTVSSRQKSKRLAAQLWGNERMGWDIVSSMPLVGFVQASGCSECFDMGRSIELSWLQVLGVALRFYKSDCSLSAGLGISWRNYRTIPDLRLTADERGGVDFAPYDPDITLQSSRVKVFSLTLPVLFTQNLYFSPRHRLGYSFGPMLCFNTHGSLRSRWLDADGAKQRESTSRIARHKFTADLFAAVGMNGLSVYVRYSPMSVLTRGLDFASFSTGVVIDL